MLDKIFALGTPGRNIVISEEEFFDAFPDGTARTDTELKRALKSLSADGFIDIKYSGGDMYCVTPIKARPAETPTEEERQAPSAPAETCYTLKISFLPAFFAALAGSAVGCALITLLFNFL